MRRHRRQVLIIAAILLLGLLPLLPGGSAGMRYTGETRLSATDVSFIGDKELEMAGNSTAIVGDVNGDGYDDILIGVPNNDDGGTKAGRVYLFLGKRTGWAQDTFISDADASFVGEVAGDMAGSNVAGAGDVNGDGLDDILVGALFNSENGAMAGKVYLIHGKTSGWAKGTSLSAADASFLGEWPLDVAGMRVASAGDVNGDGLDDILIGAHGNDEGGEAAGQVYLVFGKATGWTKGTNLSSADASFIGEREISWFGGTISSAGDVNGDGYDDILIGAYNDDESGGYSWNNTGAGQTYLVLGRASGWSMDMNISAANASFWGTTPIELSGLSVAGAGDINGDGLDDIVIGAPNNDDGGGSTAERRGAGKAYIFLGRSADGWRMDMSLDEANASIIGGREMAYLGGTVTGGGDVNGDGMDDLIVAGTGDNGISSGGGHTRVFLGRSSGWVKNMSATSADVSFLGDNIAIYSGTSVSTGGDVNGDGVDDLLIAAPCGPVYLRSEGQVFLIFVDISTGPTEVDGIEAFYDPDYTEGLDGILMQESLFIEMRGTDGDPSHRDVAVMTVSPDGSSEDGIRLRLYETGDNTGVYRGELKVGERSDEGRRTVGAHVGGTLLMMSVDDASGRSLSVEVIEVGLAIEGTTYERGEGVTVEVDSAMPAIEATVAFLFPNGTVARGLSVVTNATGQATATMTIGPDFPLGWYSVKVVEPSSASNVTFEVVNQPPFISSPQDVSFKEGTTAPAITWTCSDANPSTFIITIDGKLVDSDLWSGENISFRPNALGVGEHGITLEVVDLPGNRANDTVTVTVTAAGGGIDASGPVSVDTPPYLEPAVVGPVSLITVLIVVGALAATDVGRWGIFKALFLAAYSKRRDEKVLDNFLRGWIQGVVVRDPGIRPIDVVETFEGNYSTNLIYYHINELIRYGFVYMVQRDRKGRINKVRRGADGKVVEKDLATDTEAETSLTIRGSSVSGMTLHLYPTDMVAPRSQVNLRKKQRFLVYKFIAEHPGSSQREICEALDMVRQGVAYHLKELAKDGLLIEGSGGRTKYYYIDKEKKVELRDSVAFRPTPTTYKAPASGSRSE